MGEKIMRNPMLAAALAAAILLPPPVLTQPAVQAIAR
jgi:hypothetical protein